jgi:methyl-accepting chemotaxis protein
MPRNPKTRNENSVRLSLFWRLGLTFLTLVLAILACADWFAAGMFRSNALRDGFDQLQVLGRVAKARPPRIDDAQALNSWIAEMSSTGARVTVLAADGRVLAESQHDAEPEDQAEHPELGGALASVAGQAQAVRYDPSLDHDIQYFAVRDSSGAAPVVLRFALPIPSGQEGLIHFRRKLRLAALAILLFAAGISILFSRRYASRVQQLREFASRAAAGDFTPIPRDHGKDELAGLAGALGGTVAQLGQTIRTLTDERNRSAAILSSMVEGVR